MGDELIKICEELGLDPTGPETDASVKRRAIIVHQVVTTWTIEYDADTKKCLMARCSIKDGLV